MADLLQEIWIDQLMKGFYPTTSFLNFTTDKTSLVNNNTIHLGEAGVDPNVLINNSTYPITIVPRSDNPLEIELDKYETENTVVRRPDVIQYSYDQLEGVLFSHRSTLRTKTAMRGAHAIAPVADTSWTPVVQTTGTTNNKGFKILKFDDVLELKGRFDDLDIPLDKRMLVLNPKHTRDLINENIDAFKDLLEFNADGTPKKIAGFGVVEFTKNPVYDATTNQKKAWGAAPLSTDSYCSFAFYGDEVMKADGTPYMYSKIDDPELRGTIVGFDLRFICLPIRNKAIGALISKHQ